MFMIGVQSEFSAAHFHIGAGEGCERIHGHNYRVEARIGASDLSEGDMVIDFGLVRLMLTETTKNWDHHLLNEVDEFKGIEPTTEMICRILYEKLSARLSSPLSLLKITVWETGDCWASYGPGE